MTWGGVRKCPRPSKNDPFLKSLSSKEAKKLWDNLFPYYGLYFVYIRFTTTASVCKINARHDDDKLLFLLFYDFYASWISKRNVFISTLQTTFLKLLISLGFFVGKICTSQMYTYASSYKINAFEIRSSSTVSNVGVSGEICLRQQYFCQLYECTFMLDEHKVEWFNGHHVS